MPGKLRSVALLIVAEILVLSLWFSSAAVLSEMAAEAGLSTARLAWLSTAVQIGFGLGAIGYAALGLADVFDPRRVFAASAIVGALANLALLWVPVGGGAAILLRGLTGAAMAGVYPVGMKIIVGWGKDDRALLVGSLIAALTLGTASPHILSWLGGAQWQATIWATTGLATLGALTVLLTGLGPHHARASKFNVRAIALAWTDRPIRLAILGYLGHMWELYAFWAWIGVIAAGSLELSGASDPEGTAKLVAFVVIALGGVASVPAGRLGDRLGCARVAMACLVISGGAGLAAALCYGGPAWLMITALLIWGAAIAPDSAQYSTLVANAAPPERAGSLLTIQTATGFLLTAATVQLTPVVAEAVGWPIVLALMALGPAAGLVAMARFRRLRA